MPTYQFACPACGEIIDHRSSIGAYVSSPPAFFHCGKPMERFFSVAPAAAVTNALAGEKHYEGLRATDGSDISTRAKHRAYMKAKGLTTVDDYRDTWRKAAQERAERLAGNDPTRAQDVAAAVQRLGG